MIVYELDNSDCTKIRARVPFILCRILEQVGVLLPLSNLQELPDILDGVLVTVVTGKIDFVLIDDVEPGILERLFEKLVYVFLDEDYFSIFEEYSFRLKQPQFID